MCVVLRTLLLATRRNLCLFFAQARTDFSTFEFYGNCVIKKMCVCVKVRHTHARRPFPRAMLWFRLFNKTKIQISYIDGRAEKQQASRRNILLIVLIWKRRVYLNEINNILFNTCLNIIYFLSLSIIIYWGECVGFPSINISCRSGSTKISEYLLNFIIQS